MTRNHCRAAVHKALSGVDGAQHVEVDLAAGTAVVGGEPEPEQLVTVVKDEGYGAEIA